MKIKLPKRSLSRPNALFKLAYQRKAGTFKDRREKRSDEDHNKNWENEKTEIFSFEIILIKPEMTFEDAAERLSHIDDGLFAISNGVWSISFDREAETYAAATASALKDIEITGIDILKIIQEKK